MRKEILNGVLQFARRLRRDRSGNAMVEFALGFSLLAFCFTGTFQFGYTFYRYNTLENAVNSGARWASLAAYDSASTSPSAGFQAKVKNMVVYGNPDGTGNAIAPGLTTANVELTVTFTNDVPAAMTVNLTNYSLNSVFGTMNCTGKPKVRYAYQGIWAPIP